MRTFLRRPGGRSLGWLLVSLVAMAAVQGCNRTGAHRADEIEQISKLPNKVAVAKFAGHVSVDGQPPPLDGTLFVILNDPQHLVAGGKTYTSCDEQGNFAFTTYLNGDGAPTGKYVVTFVQFHADSGKSGRAGRYGVPSLSRDYAGPDNLKNLYSDPEKNKDNPSFVIDVADPGRTDYDFNLTVAGQDPVRSPGGYAATRLKSNFTPKL
jgi:hypothetical protein